MTTTTKAIALTGGVVLLYSLLGKKAQLSRLVFYPEKVRDINFYGLSPVMTMGLLIQNTSNDSVVINSFAGNLFANDILIGNASNFQPVIVQRNGQGVMLVTVKLSALGIVNDIIRAFQFGNFSQDLRLNGYVNAEALQIPVNLNFKIGL